MERFGARRCADNVMTINVMTMQRCVLLLQGINVGGRNRVAMADLRALLQAEGCTEVVTYLQSGNAVVTAEPVGLAVKLEQALHERVGIRSRFFLRSAEELAMVVAANPFPLRAAEPKKLHVAFLADPVDAPTVTRMGLRHADDEIGIGRHELYLSYEVNSRDSPLAGVLRQLRTPFTARNWTTVTKLAALVGSGP